MRRPLIALLTAVLAGALVLALPAGGQEPPPDETTTTTTEAPTTTEPAITLPPIGSTTTTTAPADPNDPVGGEELPEEPVPTIDETVPTDPGQHQNGAEAGRILRQELHVAEADAVTFKSTYDEVKAKVVALETEVDGLETGLTSLAAGDRAAVRRVAAARQQFEARAANALVRGRADDLAVLATMDDPNDLAVANALIGSVLNADQSSVLAYLEARKQVAGDLVAKADRLVDARHELEGARGELVAARRANVAAQFNLAVFAAGSDIVIHGFVFPVGDPHSFGDSFGAPRMTGTQYQHAHQGTDILVPEGTPLLACERGIVTEMGSDVLGGTKLWVKGQSGTYYYYAHLSAFAKDVVDGTVVAPGDIVGYVGTTGNARGGPAHLHFEIHPDGGTAVNPYPLLKVVDDLARAAKERAGIDVHVVATLDAPVGVEELRPWVEDLGRYPDWLDIVPRSVSAAPHADDVGPAWSVDLRGRLGPFARAKRLRMVRTVDEPVHVRFERAEHDGRDHSSWVLDATLDPVDDGSRLTMRLHYGGRLWMPALDRLLADEIERSRPRLLARVAE